MPFLSYLADTNIVSQRLAAEPTVIEWLKQYGESMAISTISLAEIRRGIELRPDGKGKRELERNYRYLLQDFRDAIWVFDESAAAEWGRLMAEAKTKNHPLPYADSLIGAIARSMGARVVTADRTGFLGCSRVDPWTGKEDPAW
jgi:predicted nucleic acid-binding protein